MRILILVLAVAFAGAQQESYVPENCPTNIPWDALARGASQEVNQQTDKDFGPIYEITLFDMENGYTPYESHTIGLVSNENSMPFKSFTVTLVNNDIMCLPGVLKSTNSRAREIKECPSAIINENDDDKTKVSFRWKAPECGCVTIRATVMRDMDTFYMDMEDEYDSYLTKTICPVGMQLPQEIDLSMLTGLTQEDLEKALENEDVMGMAEEDLATLEEMDAMLEITDEDIDTLENIAISIIGDELIEEVETEIAMEMEYISHPYADINMAIYNEVCSEERQDAPTTSMEIYPCCKLVGEDRRMCFERRQPPAEIMRKMEYIRLEFVCDEMSIPMNEQMRERNSEISLCCMKSEKEERRECFDESRESHYERVCQGEDIPIYFSFYNKGMSMGKDSQEKRDHICCEEEDDDRIQCFENEERREFFPNMIDEDQIANDLENKRIDRMCRHMREGSSESHERKEDIRECCDRRGREKLQCFRRLLHEYIDNVCSGESESYSYEIGRFGESIEEDRMMFPKYDRNDICCSLEGLERYKCFALKAKPAAQRIIDHVEESRISNLCDTIIVEDDISELGLGDLKTCCLLENPDKSECFKTQEMVHIDNVCDGLEMGYVYRLGHYGEVVDEEDMNEVVTMDHPCCLENGEDRYLCFESMSRLHLWTHRPRPKISQRMMMFIDPDTRFDEWHRQQVCAKVMTGNSEDVEKEIEGEDEYEVPYWHHGRRGMFSNEELMEKMRVCCEMEADESRQCMLDARKIKLDEYCETMAYTTDDYGRWRQQKQQCCELIGNERYECMDEVKAMMVMMRHKPMSRDPETRFNEDHRMRICTRYVDGNTDDVDREVDEEMGDDIEDISVDMVTKKMDRMMSFIENKLVRDNEFMEKIGECCMVDDEEGKTCFQEARKSRIDNMCEFITKDVESEDDPDWDIRGAKPEWIERKMRCCDMSGDERYECIDEIRSMKRPRMEQKWSTSRSDEERHGRRGPGMKQSPRFSKMDLPTEESEVLRMCERIAMDSEESSEMRGPRRGEGVNRNEMRDCCIERGEERTTCIRRLREERIDEFCNTAVARTALIRGMPKRSGFPPALCCRRQENERYNCFTENEQTKPVANTHVCARKVDQFCDTAVARTALVRGMPERDGFPPAMCCRMQGKSRYDCFETEMSSMVVSSEFDLTTSDESRYSNSEERVDFRMDFYHESSEEETYDAEWRKDESGRVEDTNSNEEYRVDEPVWESEEFSSSEEEIYEGDDPEDLDRCCEAGRRAGSKITEFRRVRCLRMGIRFAKKVQARGCGREFVRCCVGKEDDVITRDSPRRRDQVHPRQ
uniref:Endo16-like 235 n=1 Tax=Saccoglossus kowalevskii TaxID=10224 RepID=A0A0U2IDQ4_SACKO|nr:endo16-like 235 [Saccoglossus kowalevskii]